MLAKTLKKAKDEGPLSEADMQGYEAWYTARGLDIPDNIKNYKTSFDKEVESDKNNFKMLY